MLPLDDTEVKHFFDSIFFWRGKFRRTNAAFNGFLKSAVDSGRAADWISD
jgi:hypothetical protein